MRTLILMCLSLVVLSTACAGQTEAPYTLADTYGVPGACVVRTTEPELVLLRCTPDAELTTECRGDASPDVQAQLWTRPGAEDTPYGVTGRLALECRAE